MVDMIIAVAGDWHGNSLYASLAIDYVAQFKPDLFLHVGDFGIWPGRPGKGYRMRVDEKLEEHDLNLVVTLGNHDDWDQVGDRLKRDEYVDWTDRIKLAPRVGVVNVGGLGIAHIAGAVSVDQGIRTAHRDWWPQEALTEADLNVAEEIGSSYIDLVIAHDVPAGVNVPLMPNPPKFWKPYLELAHDNRIRMAQIISKLIGDSQPMMIHGHYHTRYDEFNVKIMEGGLLRSVHGLACDGDPLQDNIIVTEM
jgi:predicted phosphodiesterase